MEILLSAKNISKTFQGRRVLDNIDIEINNAEIVAISGPSGAGKTTLLNILSTPVSYTHLTLPTILLV